MLGKDMPYVPSKRKCATYRQMDISFLAATQPPGTDGIICFVRTFAGNGEWQRLRIFNCTFIQ